LTFCVRWGSGLPFEASPLSSARLERLGLSSPIGRHECEERIISDVMSSLEDVEKALDTLTRAEKAQLLQWVARDLGDSFPGIESRPDVSGGEPCIVRTRIPVWVLEQARRLGTTEADLLRAYPSLRAEDLANSWAYVRSHREEIVAQIRDNEAA
jgi:uncharacterized protein (DUF433 family)